MNSQIRKQLKARHLRNSGYSMTEIAKTLSIARSTASLWVRTVVLDEKAKNRIAQRIIIGRYKGSNKRAFEKKERLWSLKEVVRQKLQEVKFTIEMCRLLCAIFLWTEGGKYTDSHVSFMNSDPKMI